MSRPRVLFTPAFGPAIGGGHAFRAFTLAQALIAKGAACAVALDAEAARALAPFVPAGVEIVPSIDRLAAAEAFQAGIVVIDDYACDASDEGPLITAGLKVAVIDDLADRQHLCEFLVDPGFRREAGDYERLVTPGATILAGPNYALLRPGFADARSGALTRRKDEAFGHRALVSLGLTDVGGVTATVARHLSGLIPMDVVLGAGAASLPAISALPGVTVHVDARNMPELIAAADIAIGGGGVSVWERACLGLPQVLLILADNQAGMAKALDEVRVVIAIDAREPGFEPRLTTAVERLFSDQELRCGLSHKAARLCDGLGADRVAEALLAKLG